MRIPSKFGGENLIKYFNKNENLLDWILGLNFEFFGSRFCTRCCEFQTQILFVCSEHLKTICQTCKKEYLTRLNFKLTQRNQ